MAVEQPTKFDGFRNDFPYEPLEALGGGPCLGTLTRGLRHE